MALKRKHKAQNTPPAKKHKSRGGAEKFIFFVGDDGAILSYMQGSKLVRRLFAPNVEPDNVRSLVELMEGHPKVPIYMLIDMMDQSYVRHTLPPVSPLGVNKLVQRRLERDFAPEDITGAIPLGREKTGRKDWNFLLIALANSPTLQQWLDLVLELPNRFKGIYLVPVESQSYVKMLSSVIPRSQEAREAEWQILVSHNKVGGFRQVVLRNGKLTFTRLAQAVGESVPEVIAGNVEQEILNTIEYLRRLSYTEQAGLEVTIVVGQDIKNAIDTKRFNAVASHVFTPHEVSELLNLEQAALSGDRFGDVVMAASFARQKKLHLRMLPSYAKKLDILYNAQLGLRAVAALAIVGLLYQIVTSVMTIQGANSEEAELKRDKARVQQELATIQREVGQIDTDIATRTNIVTVYDMTEPDKFMPLTLVRRFNEIQESNVFVKKLNWTMSNDLQVVTEQSQRRGNRGSRQSSGSQGAAPMKVVMELEFTENEDNKQVFLSDANAFFRKMTEGFEDYVINYSKLPGTVGSEESLEINFDDPSTNDQLLAAGENVVEVTMIGPADEVDEDVQNQNGLGY
ncbi:MAG: hypothetical protein CMM94_05655 [Rickettsiales bacterium]|nr:hypothetical protein [Rickettsiales bacterium]